jgi:tripartite-type tricarboxylate transporter receptor subunit TctC
MCMGRTVAAESLSRIIVPAQAGGAGDLLARILAEHLGLAGAGPILVENRPGAGTIVGTEAVIRATPDGRVVLMTGPFLLIASHLRRLTVSPLSALEPICQLVSSAGLILVRASSPIGSLADLVQAARTGSSVTVAAAGPGTPHEIAFSLLGQRAGVRFNFVPFSGGAPAITATLGGHVTAVLAEQAAVSDHIESGALRPLAVTTRTRLDSLAAVPTVAETYDGYEVDFWWGLFAPPKTPAALSDRWEKLISAALTDVRVRVRLHALGFSPASVCGPAFGAFLRHQDELYGRSIRAENTKAP